MCGFNDAYDNWLSSFGLVRVVAAHQGDLGQPVCRGRWLPWCSLANLRPAGANVAAKLPLNLGRRGCKHQGGCQCAQSGAREQGWKPQFPPPTSPLM